MLYISNLRISSSVFMEQSRGFLRRDALGGTELTELTEKTLSQERFRRFAF
jgi:hypothetical protein